MKSKLLLLSWLLLATLNPNGRAAAATDQYKIGDSLAPFSTKDQHDKIYEYGAGVRRVIVTFAMSPGKAVNAFLEQRPAEFLDQQRALFISNIYGMPGFVRGFALSKMRKYPHRILLADTEGFLDQFPRQEAKATVLHLDETGSIRSIHFVDADKGMAAIFEATK